MNAAINVVETKVTIANNSFSNSFHGQCIQALAFGGSASGIEISNNTFTDDHMGSVNLYGVDNTNLRSNSIFYNSPSLHVGGAATVRLFECTNSTVSDNQIVSQKSGNYRNEGGVVVSNGHFRGNVIRSNIISGMVYGFNGAGNNTGTSIGCNIFVSNIIGDVKSWPNSSMGNQGTMFKPANNSFTNQGVVKGLINDGIQYTYSYGLGPDFEPLIVKNVVKAYTPFATSCNYSQFFPTKVMCYYGVWVQNGNDLWMDYIRLSSENVQANPGYFPEEGSNELRALRSVALANLYQVYQSAYYSSDSVGLNDQFGDSLVTLLNNDGSIEALSMLTNWYLEVGNLTAALNTINIIQTNYSDIGRVENFGEYMTYMVDFASNNYSVAWLSSNYTSIYNIALDPENYMYAKARVLCNVAAGSDSTHSLYGDVVPFIEPYNTAHAESLEVLITGSPNPFSTELNVVVANQTNVGDSITVELLYLSANIIGSHNVYLNGNSNANVQFSGLGILAAGFYAVRVIQNGSIIKSTLFQK